MELLDNQDDSEVDGFAPLAHYAKTALLVASGAAVILMYQGEVL